MQVRSVIAGLSFIGIEFLLPDVCGSRVSANGFLQVDGLSDVDVELLPGWNPDVEAVAFDGFAYLPRVRFQDGGRPVESGVSCRVLGELDAGSGIGYELVVVLYALRGGRKEGGGEEPDLIPVVALDQVSLEACGPVAHAPRPAVEVEVTIQGDAFDCELGAIERVLGTPNEAPRTRGVDTVALASLARPSVDFGACWNDRLPVVYDVFRDESDDRRIDGIALDSYGKLAGNESPVGSVLRRYAVSCIRLSGKEIEGEDGGLRRFSRFLASEQRSREDWLLLWSRGLFDIVYSFGVGFLVDCFAGSVEAWDVAFVDVGLVVVGFA